MNSEGRLAVIALSLCRGSGEKQTPPAATVPGRLRGTGSRSWKYRRRSQGSLAGRVERAEMVLEMVVHHVSLLSFK